MGYLHSGSPGPARLHSVTTAPPTPPPPAAAAREVELKLQLNPRDLPRVAALPVLRSLCDEPPRTRRLRTVYHDTPDLRLASAGVALRVRQSGEGHIQALKTMAGESTDDSAGVAVRREWEWPLPGDRPDLSLLEGSGAGGMIPDEARARLRPLFVTDFMRTVLVVRPDSGTVIEVAIDDGAITAGDRTERISEVELELKAGRVVRLFELALALQRFVPMRIGTENKAEVGYRLVTGRKPRPVLPEPTALSPVATMAEAFRHVVRQGIRHTLANEPCALADGDPEGLHQIRVALRRLRIALKLFHPVTQSAETAELRAEIGWLSDRLAPARGWDALSALLDGADAGLVGAVAAARQGPLEDAVAALGSARASRLVLALGTWLEDGGWHARAAAETRALLDRPMKDSAGPWLTALHAKARRAGKTVGPSSAKDAEKLRRRLRRLGYAADFFRGLYPPAAARPFLDALHPVLATLDALHDADTGQHLLASLADGEPALRKPASAAARHLDRLADTHRKALPDVWRAWRDTPVFWG